MGVGTPEDLIEAVQRGVDMFDCVLPTRNGRHGAVFSRFGTINLANARHRDDPRPLDEESSHEATRTYSRAYLSHLVRVNELLGQMLLSAINLAYYQRAHGRPARSDRARPSGGVLRGDAGGLGARRSAAALSYRDPELAADLIRGGSRFSDKIMLERKYHQA